MVNKTDPSDNKHSGKLTASTNGKVWSNLRSYSLLTKLFIRGLSAMLSAIERFR